MTNKREDECWENKCYRKCTHTVFWPGRNPPPKYCKEHALIISNIGDAMGLSVYWKEINEEGN